MQEPLPQYPGIDTSENVMQLESTSGSFSLVPAHTRVMSPSTNTNDAQAAALATYGTDANSQVLMLDLRAPCTRCGEMLNDPVICASCGVMGHPYCIKSVLFKDYQFCEVCYPAVSNSYHSAVTAEACGAAAAYAAASAAGEHCARRTDRRQAEHGVEA